MLIGAGYATWNDTVSLNHSVATGDLAVEFMDGYGSMS